MFEKIKKFGMLTGWALATITLAGMILSTIWWLMGDKVAEFIRDTVEPERASRCVTFPPSGHEVEDARPGEWTKVTWRGIHRTENCGRPELVGVVVNGDGVYHEAVINTSGINLPVGIHEEFPYKFQVPEGAEPGRAWFRVTLDFPNQGLSVNSPRVYFRILDEDEENDTERTANDLTRNRSISRGD